MIARLIKRLHDLRNEQSNAKTPAERAVIQAEIVSIQAKLLEYELAGNIQ